MLQVPTMVYGTRYDSASQAHRLFEALHQLDEAGASRAYARLPRKRGVAWRCTTGSSGRRPFRW